MADKREVRVTILNQSFTLLTAGDPGEVVDLAQQVDDLMHGIAGRSPNLDSTRVAVLACLHLAEQLHTREADVDSKLREFSGLLEKALDPGVAGG
jgi:cell division protein ZapA